MRQLLAALAAIGRTVGRILLGIIFVVAALAFLGGEYSIAIDVKASPHWAHIGFLLLLLIAGASLLFPEWAKTFFGWLIELVRSARGGKGGDK